MHRLIRELAGQNRTILLSSHDMREVEELCSRVAIIVGGRMLAEGSPEQLRGQARLWVLTGGRSGGADSLRSPAGRRKPRGRRVPGQVR